MKLFASKSMKNEVYLKITTNNFSMQALKEALGLEMKGKSPLENSKSLKEILMNVNKNEVSLIENPTRSIILSYLKVI